MPNKLSGIYRIYLTSIENPKVQYSYIGVSKDIQTRVSTHFANLKEYVKNPKKLETTLSTKKIPIQGILYHKWALLILLLDIDLSDFKWEILLKKNFQKSDDIEIEEMNYIYKYNSELMGLNGIFAKFKAKEKEINWPEKPSCHSKKVVEISKKKWEEYEKILDKNIEKTLPWVSYEMESMLGRKLPNSTERVKGFPNPFIELMAGIKPTGKIIYEKFIKKMLVKFNKRKSELIEAANSKKKNHF